MRQKIGRKRYYTMREIEELSGEPMWTLKRWLARAKRGALKYRGRKIDVRKDVFTRQLHISEEFLRVIKDPKERFQVVTGRAEK